ncbi:DNA polymerase theta-like [Teleopsis dalmanni]|uniref:DNA polymerase theta-like n=1 Tax=Teleopsis dalmanni TaxID=139649 RepID=UPI0018CD80D5|nr:DNA polymerase theta-like [Teleopsis dalmanni]
MVEPNLQNVAKNFEVYTGEDSDNLEISCRRAFYPTDPKRWLISIDFCQLEMRILAHLSKDPALLEVMRTKKDIFTAIAASWYKVSDDNVTDQLRNDTKKICYGIVYGMGMCSLADSLKCTEEQANLLSREFHAAYPYIRTYAEKIVRFARINGYIETITGRRRYVENINNADIRIKNQAERRAINASIQGSAADIVKRAILLTEKNIQKYSSDLGIEENSVRLVLHVHDELIFEVPKDKAKHIAKVLSTTMEKCVQLKIPLKVKVKIGKSWGDLK